MNMLAAVVIRHDLDKLIRLLKLGCREDLPHSVVLNSILQEICR